MNSQRHLQFTELPGMRRLFLDVLSGAAKGYYHYHFADSKSYTKVQSSLQTRSFQRQEIADALVELNRSYGAGKSTFENIEKLRRPETTVVITGQQVALFGGPLYTFYKAALLIKLAESNCKRLNADVVPIFWLAADDADFEEVARITLPTAADDLATLEYRPEHDIVGQPMSHVTLNDQIVPLIDEYRKALPQTEFTADLIERLREFYHPGESIVTAFGRYLQHVFRDKGLILVDPSHEAFRKLAAPIFKRELELCRVSASMIAEQNERLASDGYHLQVTRPQHYSNLFFYDGKRSRVDITEDGFVISGRHYSQAELEEKIDSDPALFSPNVFLRPIVQSHLFPTLIHFVGPAEAAYLSQIKGLFDLFEQQAPVVCPRFSATIIEKKIAKILNKYSLTVSDLGGDLHQLINQQVQRSFPLEIDGQFKLAKAEITSHLEKLQTLFDGTDEGLLTTAKKTAGKIDMELNSLQKKVHQAHKKKSKVLTDQINRAAHHLFPAGNLQERVFRINYYIARYGPRIVDYLYDRVDCDSAVHHLIYLDEV